MAIAAFAKGGAAHRLDPGQIKSILEQRLAGRAVPPAVLEHVLQEICRLIDEALLASSSSHPR